MRRRCVPLAIALLMATACSVPRDSSARVIPNEPIELRVPSTSCDLGTASVAAAKLYFIRPSDDKLEARSVFVEQPAGALQLLDALKCAPDGYSSAIPDTVQFQALPGEGDNQLTVLLFQFPVKNLNPAAQVKVFQQIVFTLWASANISRVTFSVNNAPYKVPLLNGTKDENQPVSIFDYDSGTIYTTTTTTTTTTLAPTTLAPTTLAPTTIPCSTRPGSTVSGCTPPPPSATSR